MGPARSRNRPWPKRRQKKHRGEHEVPERAATECGLAKGNVVAPVINDIHHKGFRFTVLLAGPKTGSS